MRSIVLSLALLVACSHDAPAPAPPPRRSASAASEPTPPPTPPAPIASAAVDSGTTATPEPTTAEVDAGPTVPLASLPTTKEWPFHKWDRAEAILFNQVKYGPGMELYAFEEKKGWNRKIADRKKIDEAQAKKAAGWVIQTGGSVPISKCPFPRHAVVFFAGNTPVGSANVCFQCGDILVWPEIDKEKVFEDAAKMKKKMAVYDKVFPLWRKFYEDEVKFPVLEF